MWAIHFTLPYEGNPKALLEAMACGLPVIGTDVDGIKEIIKHEENGYLCETSAESIKKAISELIKDEDLQKKISENARMTTVENFSLEKVFQREIRLYKELWSSIGFVNFSEEKVRRIYKFLVKVSLILHSFFYKLSSILAIEAEGGLHPKHRLMNRPKFFVDNTEPHDIVLDIGRGNGALACDLSKKANRAWQEWYFIRYWFKFN